MSNNMTEARSQRSKAFSTKTMAMQVGNLNNSHALSETSQQDASSSHGIF